MKLSLMHNLSLKSLICLWVVVACALFMASCQPAQQQQANGNAAGANSDAANTSQAAAPSGYIDLVGKWEGQSGGQPSTLVITSHSGEYFNGTKTVGDFQIKVAGTVDLKTRQINIRETDVIKGQGSYPLGFGTGAIDASGRQMSGEWKAKGSASTFSFSK